MCFYRDQSLTQQSLKKLQYLKAVSQNEQNVETEYSSTEASPDISKQLLLDEIFNRKKQELDKKAPGLFDELQRLSNNQTESYAQTSPTQENFLSIDNSKMFQSQQSILENYQAEQMNSLQLLSQLQGQIPQLLQKSNQIQLDNNVRDSIFNLMMVNTEMLGQLTQGFNYNSFQAAKLCQEAHVIKSTLPSSSTSEEKPTLLSIPKGEAKLSYNPTSASLFKHLCGNCSNLPYELVVEGEVPTSVFRERNLKFNVRLVDSQTKQPVLNHGKIFVQMTMHTWEIPSNVIVKNKLGNNIIHGEDERELKQGEICFDKIQINEVTSKFINGYIAILISPKRPKNYGTTLMRSENDSCSIKYEDIKPLMLEKIIVKSKKKKNNSKKNL